MANNVEINLKAKTTDFETGLDKAIKGLETFGKKGGEADKAMTAALKHINEAAKNNIDELQQNMARFNVKSDLRINVNLEVLAKAKEGVNALFDRIQSGGASIAETTAALNNMNAQMANLNSHQTRGQFKDLGIMSEASIEAMKVKAISAFAEIERSGVATPNDIIRAHEAMTAKIEELNALTVTQAEKTAAARINIAHEEALAEIRTYEEAALMNQKFEYEKQRSAEKTAAARILALKEVAAQERASYAAQGMSGSGAAASLIGQPLAGSGFANDLKAQMEASAASAQIRSREMASYAASAMQGEAAAARLSGHVHAGADFTSQLKSQMQEAAGHAERARHGINGWSLASVAAIAKVQIMYSLINNIMSAIGSMPGVAVDAIENYKSSIVSNAAMITSMQVGVRDIGAAYRENKVYAEAVQNVLIKMDAETAASGKNLIDMNNQFMQQGVLLDTNNKKQVDGFKNIANALAAITANDPNKDMQYAQEVRSMRDFSDRPGNRLVQYLKSQGVTKEMVEDWKKIGESTQNYGYLLEQLNPYFKGFAAAQGDINDLWETGKSTLVTIRDDILRGGLSEGFSHIINLMKDLNKWAEENKFKIQAMIKDGFNQIETTAKILWNMRGAFVALGETALYASIVIGIGSVIIKIQELATAIGTMNTAAKAGILVRVLTNPVAAVGALAIGTTALAINDSMERSKAEAEAKKIGAFTRQDILPGHVAEIRKKYGPISAQEIMGKFANSEIQLETVLSDSYEYIGQRVVFNEAAIKAAKVPYPKNIKSAGMGSETEAADYTDRWNSYVSALQSFENKGEGNSYVGQVKKIDEQLQNLKVTYGSLDVAHKKLTDDLHEGGAIEYFEKLAKVAKDTAWYLNVQKEATEGLNQAASDKAIFNIANMNGDLSTGRYKATNPLNRVKASIGNNGEMDHPDYQAVTGAGYRLRSNNDYQISQKGPDLEKMASDAKAAQQLQIRMDKEILATHQSDEVTRLATVNDELNTELEMRITQADAMLVNEEKKWELMLQAEAVYNAKRKKLTEFSWSAVGSVVAGQLTEMASMMNKANADQFAAYKIMAMGTAAINTALAIGGILAHTGELGPFALPLAVTAGALGAAQMAFIAAQQPPQAREFGGPVVAGQSYIVGEKRPELFTPGASGVITPYVPEGGGNTNNVTQVIQVSTGVADTVRAEIGRMLPLLRAQAVAAVQQAQRSGQMQPA